MSKNRYIIPKIFADDYAMVSRQAVSNACRTGKALHPALKGTLIDLDHPSAVAYIKKQVADKTKKVAKKAVKEHKAAVAVTKGATTVAAEPTEQIEPQEDISFDEVKNMTVGALIAKFGTVDGYSRWLVSYKSQCDIELKQLNILEKKGELISRQLVEDHIFGPLDGTFRKLLTDASKSLALRVPAAIKSDDAACMDAWAKDHGIDPKVVADLRARMGGGSAEDIERLISGVLSTHVKGVKGKIAKVLRDA